MVTNSEELPAFVQLWRDHGGDRADINPICAVAERTAALQPFAESEVISRDERRRHPLWQEFYDRLDMPHVATTILLREGPERVVLSAIRTARQGHFTTDDIALLQAIGGRWRRAVLQARSLGADAERLAMGALDAAAVAAFILDAFGQVRLSTAAAEALLRHNALKLRARRLECRQPAGTAMLHSALGACHRSGVAQQVEVDNGERCGLRLTVSRLPDTSTCFAVGPLYVAVCEERMRLPRLTPAEGEVAAALLRGCSLAEIAERRGAALMTVKSQAKAIYAKAEVGGQVELIRVFGLPNAAPDNGV